MSSKNDFVDDVMQELDNNNDQKDINFQPEMVYVDSMHQSQPKNEYQQQMMQQQMPMQQMPMQHMPMQQMPMQQMPMQQMPMQQSNLNGGGSHDMDNYDMPNLDTYGMEVDTDDKTTNILNKILDEIKLPIIVIVMYFLLTIPQIGMFIKNFLMGYLNNSVYVNIILSLLFGVVFYAIVKVLV